MKLKVLAVKGNEVQTTDGKNTTVYSRGTLEDMIKDGRVEIDAPKIKCLDKIRDNNNNIIAYLLCDENGNQRKVRALELKQAMYNYQVNCINLKLSSDYKIINKNYEQPKNKTHIPRLDLDKIVNELNTKLKNFDQRFEVRLSGGLNGILSIYENSNYKWHGANWGTDDNEVGIYGILNRGKAKALFEISLSDNKLNECDVENAVFIIGDEIRTILFVGLYGTTVDVRNVLISKTDKSDEELTEKVIERLEILFRYSAEDYIAWE